jgi:hypothetical protein
MNEEKLLELFSLLEPMIDEDFPDGIGENHGTCATDKYVTAARAYKEGLELLRDVQGAGQAGELVRRCKSMSLHPAVKRAGKVFRKAFKEAARLIDSQARELVDRDSRLAGYKVVTDALVERREELKRELAAAQALCNRLKQEAQIQAGEMRTQRSTVHKTYQVLTGATGEPGDWNGAKPARKVMAQLTAANKELEWLRENALKTLKEMGQPTDGLVDPVFTLCVLAHGGADQKGGE